MKILIVTQKVDRTDPILGFFHRWIEEFAKHVDMVTVIGQYVGAFSLPHNVQVLSLRKEDGKTNIAQVIRFWKLIVAHRKEYDIAFVHMTPIWILIGAPLWLFMRKTMYLWYEIKRGSWKLSAALHCVKKVFAASEHGLPGVAKKQVIVGHGIDLDQFTLDPTMREMHHLVAVGRLTRIKHYEDILKALADLPQCRLTIAGGTITEDDKNVEQTLHTLMHRLDIADRVEVGWVPPEAMPHLLRRAACMLHASQGGLDKVVLQAMACGCPVVSTSEAAMSILPQECTATPETLASQVQHILALSSEDRGRLVDTLRSIVETEHSLKSCIAQLVREME